MARKDEPRRVRDSSSRVEIPEEGQPAGKDFPPTESAIRPEERGHLVKDSNAYENMGGADIEDRGEGQRGPFDVPDDDLSGEGWSPPTHPGGGWEHPVETMLEDRLEETDEPPGARKPEQS